MWSPAHKGHSVFLSGIGGRLPNGGWKPRCKHLLDLPLPGDTSTHLPRAACRLPGTICSSGSLVRAGSERPRECEQLGSEPPHCHTGLGGIGPVPLDSEGGVRVHHKQNTFMGVRWPRRKPRAWGSKFFGVGLSFAFLRSSWKDLGRSANLSGMPHFAHL